MSLPVRVAAAAVTVVTAVSVSSAIFGSPAQSSHQAPSDTQSSLYVDQEGRTTENDRLIRNILQDSRTSDELSSVEDQRAAGDVLKSILERP